MNTSTAVSNGKSNARTLKGGRNTKAAAYMSTVMGETTV